MDATKTKTIAVDFDGTIVENEYPKIGKEKPFAIETLKMLAKRRHRLILWTMREGPLLEEAVEWCRQRGLEFYAVNKNYPEEKRLTNPRKLNVTVFIDDKNLGGIPDWGTIYQIIEAPTGKNTGGMGYVQWQPARKKKHWWQR